MKKLIRFIFKQYSVMPSWTGGLVVVHLEMLGIVGLFTFAGVMNGVWVDHPGWHHYFLNNFLIFLFCFIPVFEIVALFYYKFMVYARQKYQQYQSFQAERSPVIQRLDKIMGKLGIDEKTD